MRTEVHFEHPAPFIGTEEGKEAKLSVKGADWLVSVLKAIPDLEIDSSLSQQKWGANISVKRRRMKFIIGLYGDRGPTDQRRFWIIYIDHGGVSPWIQRLRPSAQVAYQSLIQDLYNTLLLDSSIVNMYWYTRAKIKGYSTDA